MGPRDEDPALAAIGQPIDFAALQRRRDDLRAVEDEQVLAVCRELLPTFESSAEALAQNEALRTMAEASAAVQRYAADRGEGELARRMIQAMVWIGEGAAQSYTEDAYT